MKLPIGFDIHSLEVFMLTAELGGMTQSAEHLGMTQSAVSQIVSKLESALETRLFDRTTRPLTLTASGRFLLNDGARLVADAKRLASEMRGLGNLPMNSVTIAMAESMANLVTVPLLRELGGNAGQWLIRSGTSPAQHEDFLNRKIDILVTASTDLEGADGFDQMPIFDEEFVLAFPAGHAGAVDQIGDIQDLPFIRYSLKSAIGLRIESQLSRMRSKLKNSVEVDSTAQQLTAISEGLGWGITTPLCLASHPALFERLRVEPMRQAQFRRYFTLIARRGEFGDLPGKLATSIRGSIQEIGLAPLFAAHPWLEQKVRWPETAKAG
ncbi:LysR family transcriptional regulator [Paraurantiacibacter namhicola]|uniref:HTH-type transcriptional regulator GltR n=1 Tax=Paraurantiacibacter namhicola TaxID=645517 RepID=A0A1C7D527_9SPHN|nr:LysR family transcriptional regulator [Paraurantiacibacter namhicola]ANU06431.1 HTH-type transcriptional regulator GltR [Paraurantiacibacter namhicola]